MLDCVVVGLGAAGSAALGALARDGASVSGIDRFAPPHAQGSSHGETRLLRVAYAEGALYAPMARRSITLWRDLELRTGPDLFRQSGVLYAGPQSSPFLSASLASAREYDVDVDALTSDDRVRLDAGLRVPPNWICFAEREGGYLFVDKAIAALLADARAHGAEVRDNDACIAIEPRAESVHIVTAKDRIVARTCIVAAGAWTAELLPQLAPYLSIERKTVHWFADPQYLYSPDRFRPFLIDDEAGRQFYGFPDCGTGVKVAEHTEASARIAGPDDVNRTITPDDTRDVEAFAARSLPGLGSLERSVTCLYPMSRDGHFIIDALPGSDRVYVAAGLSGHGFKFTPVIGEAAANLAMGRTQTINLAPFAIGRFDE